MSLSKFERDHITNGGKLLVVKEDTSTNRWHVVDVMPGGNKLPFGNDGFSEASEANNAAYGLYFLTDVPSLVRDAEVNDWRDDCREYI